MNVLTQQNNVRYHVVRLLTNFDHSRKRLSLLATRYLNRVPEIDHPEEITFLVQEITRWRGYLDSVIGHSYRGHFSKSEYLLKNILRLAAYEMIFRNQVPVYAVVNEAVNLTRKMVNERAAGLTNAVLRKVAGRGYSKPGVVVKSDSPAQIAAATSHPQWLIERWLRHYGYDETINLCQWNNKVPVFTVWMNSARVDRVRWEKKLEVLGIKWSRSTVLRDIYHVDSISTILRSDVFQQGWFIVQDTAAALITELATHNPRERILDVCCAPGGKMAVLAVRLGEDVQIIASDRDEVRLQQVRNTLERLRITNVTVQRKDATKDDFSESDLILIDAPCTGTGVMSKRADLRWRRSNENIQEMQSLQLEILRHMANFLAVNGQIIYSTCSLEPEENWGVVDILLKERDDLKVVPVEKITLRTFLDDRGAISTFPPRHNMDGTFGVVLRKTV